MIAMVHLVEYLTEHVMHLTDLIMQKTDLPHDLLKLFCLLTDFDANLFSAVSMHILSVRDSVESVENINFSGLVEIEGRHFGTGTQMWKRSRAWRNLSLLHRFLEVENEAIPVRDLVPVSGKYGKDVGATQYDGTYF